VASTFRGVDVADLVGLDSPVAHGEAHRFLGTGAVGRRGRDVVRVRGLPKPTTSA